MTRLTGMFRVFDFFMLRAPLLPIEQHQLLSEQGIKRVVELSNDPIILEALAISSPSLLDALSHISDEVTSRKQEQAVHSFLRYLLRMMSRATPFGLCSGVTYGRFSERSWLELQDAAQHHKHARPDMEWLLKVVEQLESNQQVAEQLRVQVNTMIYRHGTRANLPYVTRYGQTDEKGKAVYNRVSVKATPVLDFVIQEAKCPLPFAELRAKIGQAFPGASDEMINRFLFELIKQEYLLTDLRPPTTITDPFAYVRKTLNGIRGVEDVQEQMQNIADRIAHYERLPLGEGEVWFRQLAKDMKKLATVKSPLQVDLELGKQEVTLPQVVGEEVAKAAEIFWRLSSGGKRFPHLESYRNEFMEKYGVQREIPLLELLDEDLGLGAPQSYQFPMSHREETNAPQGDKKRSALLLSWVQHAIVRGQSELVLSDEMMQQLEPEDLDLSLVPPSLELYVTVLASSAEALEHGDFRLTFSPFPASSGAGKTFGRFVDVLDAELYPLLQQVHEAEQAMHADHMFAELAYLPSTGRATNVVLTKNIRPYEIVFGTTSSKGEQETIPVSDLVVGLKDGQFYLRSRTFGKEVIPKVGHMLNPQLAPNVYRFMLEVGMIRYRHVNGFSWGELERAPMLPRLRYDRFILSPAMWRIDANTPAYEHHADERRWQDAMFQWRTEWNVPRHVYLTEADHRILLDLEQPLHLELLRVEVQKSGKATLVEVAADLSETVVSGQQGHFVGEFVFPLQKVIWQEQPISTPVVRQEGPVIPAEIPATKRVFFPGSEWLYVKLYGVSSRQDEFIATRLREFCRQMEAEGLADFSYYIRYADPKPHLRLRFHGEPSRLLAELLPRMTAWAQQLHQEGLLSTFVLDTYEPEIERYGGTELMHRAEQLFGVDSIVTAQWILAKRFGKLELDFNLVGVISLIDLMQQFGLSTEEQYQWLDRRFSRKEYLQEFRNDRRLYLAVANPQGAWQGLQQHPAGAVILDMLQLRQPVLHNYVQAVREAEKKGELLNQVDDLLGSVMHMHMNRLYGIDREQERKVMTLTRHTLNGLRFVGGEADGA